MTTRYKCPVCGSTKPYVEGAVLWRELIDNWELTPVEVAYINRQQGTHCPDCGSNLRSQALALALLTTLNAQGALAQLRTNLSILEINECGHLHQHLAKLAGHSYTEYPFTDMQSMQAFAAGTFDIVLHSDTLEHIPNPLLALHECYRILKSPGYCIFTVPTLVNKLTRSTAGRPPTYHGSSGVAYEAMRVHTEYGLDTWKQVVEAGFDECRIVTLEYPAAIAYVGVKR